MSTSLRHFMAIGLTTALAFRLCQDGFEQHTFRPGHPTTFDMVWFTLAAFFGSLGAISLLIFPIVITAEHFSGKRRTPRAIFILALPALIPMVPFLLMTHFDGNNQTTGDFEFPFLESAFAYTFAGSILFFVLFYFYCGIACVGWVTAHLSCRFKHRSKTTLEPTLTAS